MKDGVGLKEITLSVENRGFHVILSEASLGAAASPMGEDGPMSPVNQAFDTMLGAALQLPKMKNPGEEIGLNFDGRIAGLMDGVA